jgi:hypothetical protein
VWRRVFGLPEFREKSLWLGNCILAMTQLLKILRSQIVTSNFVGQGRREGIPNRWQILIASRFTISVWRGTGALALFVGITKME